MSVEADTQADEVGPPICSAKGCRTAAVFDLGWNNPKIHPPERRKHWLACAEHRDQLSAFLSARGFLREVGELSEGSEESEGSAADR